MMYYKTLKIRLFPTKEQEEIMWKHVHAARFIWNYMLNMELERYKNGESYLSNNEMSKIITQMKKEEQYSWLNDVAVHTLYLICDNLHNTYMKMFDHKCNLPRFKSRKKSNIYFPLRQYIGAVYFKNNLLTLPKIGKVKYKTKYDIKQGRDVKIINPCIINKNGKWVFCMRVLCENQTQQNTKGKMGIDLGIKNLAIVSFENEQLVFDNINKSKRMRNLYHKLKYLQRKVARKYYHNRSFQKTKNIEKIELKIKDIYYHISCIKHNYIHQITHKLISLLPQRVVMETLYVTEMVKNKHLSKAIQEQNFNEFIRIMKYKCEINGIEFIQADKYFPSSKTCSCCGKIKKNLKLSDRIYKCNYCGLIIDRDYNAAINLMNYGT